VGVFFPFLLLPLSSLINSLFTFALVISNSLIPAFW
jgi:hypothetical protein